MLQSLPSIPEGVTNEGLIAVLFLVLLGAAVIVYIVSKGYLKLGADNGDLKLLISDIDRLITSCDRLTDSIDELSKKVSATNELTSEVRGMRVNIHSNVMPALAGLSLAYMKLAKLDDLAHEESDRFKSEGINPKHPTRDRRDGDRKKI